MRRLPSMLSSMKVMANSCPLRAQLRSLPRNRFLASCWVMVEPPTTFGSARAAGFAAAAVGAGRCGTWRAARRSISALILATRSSAFWLRSQAFSSASHSTPLCSLKPASSDAMTARFSCSEMCS